ncbi:SpvB/TcaC N-terminal domain-containing protein [Pendulispora albinea]|uniref:Rhs family carbohydrate-binding protein n=1 Tax=Pendulispora albinea TaxID=2741071 RepID=A0ABZ2LRR9_9BACT
MREQRSAPHAAAVLPVPLLPTSVSQSGASAGTDPWTLFDGRASTAIEAQPGEGIRFEVVLEGPTKLAALSFLGPTEGTVSVFSQGDGFELRPIAGWTNIAIRAAAGTWKRLDTRDEIPAKRLVVQWTGKTPRGPSEMGLWGFTLPRHGVPDAELADRILSDAAPGAVAVRATPNEGHIARVALHSSEVNRPARFRAMLPGEPRSWSRAFLVYELAGLRHWREVVRQINGLSIRGEAWSPSANGSSTMGGGLQVEEVDPSWLHSGDNEIQFLPLPGLNAPEYAVRHVRIVGVPLARVVENPPVHAGEKDRRIVLESPSQVHDLVFELGKATDGHMLVRAPGAKMVPVQIDLKGLEAGWHRVDIGRLPVTHTIAITLDGTKTPSRRSLESIAHVVSDVAVTASAIPRESDEQRIAVSYPLHGECVDHYADVRGFVKTLAPSDGIVALAANGREVKTALREDKSFALVVPEPDFFVGRAWDVTLQATLSSGKRLQRSVRVGPCLDPAVKSDASMLEDDGAPFGEVVRAGEAKAITFGGAKLEIPAGAVDKDVRITVRPLVAGQIPRMSHGMANVTPEGRAFRFGPHGLKFKKPIAITLPYDRASLGEGMHERHIFAFYYDEPLGKWQRIGRVGGAGNGELTSLTEHFTDFVNATLAMPDSPGPVSFDPNEMKGIKLASPSAGVDLIAPPQANASGSAALAYPIEVPPGRNGVAPQLAFTYNSARTNGWLGVGWDVSLSSIEIDTRFGVPTYGAPELAALTKADTYLLDGEQLRATGEDSFVRRTEGRFDRIIRKRDGQGCVTGWEVTDKSGTISTYGGQDRAAVLADPDNPCRAFRWALRSVRDTFGNVMSVTYAKDSGSLGDPFVALYPEWIDYASNASGLSAPYHVHFVRDVADARPDRISSGRPGFLERIRHRLDRIEVLYQATVIRQYQLGYLPDSVEHFHKSLLGSIAVLGLKGPQGASELDRHSFEYKAAPQMSPGGSIDGFDPKIPWGSVPTDDPLTRGNDSLGGLRGEVGIGFGPFAATVSAGGTSGGQTTHRSLIDYNADGLPDFAVDTGAAAFNFLRPGLSVRNPNPNRIHLQEAELKGLESLGHAGSSGWMVGGQIGIQGGPGVGASYSRTSTEDDKIFADMDADGLVDFVTLEDGFVSWHQNLGKGQFAGGARLGGALNPSGNKPDGAIAKQAARAGFRRVSPLLRWTAPFTGTIVFAGEIHKLRAGGNGVVTAVYHGKGGTPPTTPRTLTRVWERYFAPDDLRTCVPYNSTQGCVPGAQGFSLDVERGDRIYTTLTPFHDPNGSDQQFTLETQFNDTEWNPTIRYETCDPTLIEPYGAPVCVFSQKNDHRVAGQPKMTWTSAFGDAESGPIPVHIEGLLAKATTSDDVYYSIIKTNQNGDRIEDVVEPTLLAGGSAFNLPISVDTPMLEGQGLEFHIVSQTPIDPARIQWVPKVTYKKYCKVDPEQKKRVCGDVTCTTSAENQTVCTMAGDPVPGAVIPPDLVSQAITVFQTIPQMDTPSATKTYIVPTGGTLKVHASVALQDENGPSATLLIQGVHRLYAKKYFDPGSTGSFDVIVNAAAGDRLFATLVMDEPTTKFQAGAYLPDSGTFIPITVQYPDHTFDGKEPDGKRPLDPMAGGFHRWFTGFYNGDTDFAESGILFPFNADGTFRSNPPSFQLAAPRRLAPEPAWEGPGNAYILAGQQSCSRANLGGGFGSSGKLKSLRASTTWNVGYDANIVVAGAGASHGQSNGDHDFFDFNGDRYPDAVSLDGVVQFNDGQIKNGLGGGFLAPVGVPNLGSLDTLRRVNHGSANVRTDAVGKLLAHVVGGDGGLLKSMLQGFAVGADYGQSATSHEWTDINGDALPDFVFRDPSSPNHFTVRLNYGYRLGNAIPWTAEGWQNGKIVPAAFDEVSGSILESVAETFGAIRGANGVRLQDSGSVSAGINAVVAGGGVTYNVSRTLVDMTDVTGDGLPDQVMLRPGENALRVRQNLGDRFDGNEVIWNVPSWGISDSGKFSFLGGIDDGIHVRRSTTYSADFHFRICFFICIGISGFWSHGTSEAFATFEDVDGDSLPDFVYKGNGHAVFAKRNKAGGVNLLTTVHRPLGGTIALDYTTEGNLVGRADLPAGSPKVDEPWNKYVLSKVDVDDGRGNHYVRDFSYEPSGFFDRVEREDYGFAKVTTKLEDASTTESHYLNQDFYRRGLAAQTAMRDATGALFTSERVVYAQPSSSSPSEPLTGTFFPKEISRTSNWYEGTTSDLSNPGKSTTENRFWDDKGNLTDREVFADDGPADDVLYHVTYDPSLAQGGIFRPSQVTAKGRDGALLRDRKATYHANGALKTLTNVVIGGRDPLTNQPYTGDPAKNPTWQFTYDPYGNLQETIDPGGYTLTYAYDDVARSYRTSTLDSFGYISTSVPNYLFGTVDATNDVNQQTTLFRYDDFGRLVKVFGPNDVGANEPTIAFSYSLQGAGSPLPAYATTAHKDVRHPGDPIVTATFADGLERTIQTKKELEKDTGAGTALGMSVSGLIQFDVRGRAEKQGQPIFDTGAPGTFVLAPMKNPTSFTYDVMDRTRSMQMPDGALTTTTYGIEPFEGIARFTTTVRDPNVNAGGGLPGAAQKSFSDVRGLVLALQESNRLTAGGPRTTLVTRYAYNPIEELAQVTDAKGNVTKAGYDTVGRMVSLTSPDAGRTDWMYDRSGNLGAKETPRLRSIQKAIRYTYDFNRLRKVDYGASTPSVTYAYGDASQAGDAAHNLAGRIALETSEAGTKAYKYDRLGNVSEERWILNPLRSTEDEKYDRTMSWSYDSFGRLLAMQFPGEEIETVTYGYDRGGHVTSATGVTPSSGPSGGETVTPYLTFVGYDEFEQRTRLTSGNGITTKYVYEPRTRRLTEINADYRDPYLVFHDLPARPMQKLRYTYDPAGNITQIRNDAPFDTDRARTVAVGTVAENFAYDDLYQLKNANGIHQEDEPWRTTFGLGFTYDAAGNILQKAQRADHESFFAGEWTKDYPIDEVTYKADYTYAGPRAHAPTVIVDTLEGAESTKKRFLEYDLDGNQIESRYGLTRRTLTWDEEDRLKAVNEGTTKLSKALYDGSGERAMSLQWVEEETAHFGQNLTLRDGKVPTKHIFAGGTRIASKTGEGPEWVNPSTTVYLHDDHLGSAHYITSNEQEIVTHEEYFPTGELWVDERDPTTEIGPRYLFTGKELDAETGLYYFGARYYDSRLSQWNSPDPAMRSYMQNDRGAGMRMPRNLGTYTYAWNRPTLLRDPTGRSVAPRAYDAFTVFARATSNALIPAATAAVLGFLAGGPAGALAGFAGGLGWQTAGVLGVSTTIGLGALGAIHGYRLAQAKSYHSAQGFAAFLLDNTWAVHNSLVGSIYATALLGNPIAQNASEGSGGLYLQHQLVPPYDTTFGNVTAGTKVSRHEAIHAWQARVFGPTFYPIYGASYALNTAVPWWLIPKALGAWSNKPIDSAKHYFTHGVYPFVPFEMMSYAFEGSPP